ncbi:MAG: hypothetical protein LBI88_02510 [Deltaproteobacteria bacterium]|nr:hypothetical protein [Deltaproteobacteria bacterium]
MAQSGTSSEDIWYQYGGARVAYTAVTRPKQLYTGYGAVRDPALYGQAPATTAAKTSPQKRPKPKAAAAVPRDPNCPPCPPTDTAAHTPQSANPPVGTAFSAPVQGAVGSAPPPAPAPAGPNAAAPLPSPPIAPSAPGT